MKNIFSFICIIPGIVLLIIFFAPPAENHGFSRGWIGETKWCHGLARGAPQATVDYINL